MLRKAGKTLTTTDLHRLQTRTFFGKEKKSLAYVIAIMNMILHGIEAPNILHVNTLAENLADVQEAALAELKKALLHQAFAGEL